jgi:ABC-type glycerol-3-phosphate transport system substrate-binding protein
MSIKGSEKTDISPDLAGAAEAFNKASGTWDVDYGQWYKSLNKATESAIASLLNGEITPEQCLDRMEKAAEATRKDRSIPKHRVQ